MSDFEAFFRMIFSAIAWFIKAVITVLIVIIVILVLALIGSHFK